MEFCFLFISLHFIIFCQIIFQNILLKESDQLEIATNDFYCLTYNLIGELIEKVSDSRIKPEDHIIAVSIKRLKKSNYQLTVNRSIRGSYKMGDTLIIECPDRKMKKLVLNYWRIFNNRTKKLKAGFFEQLHLRNKSLILNTPLPTYNAPDYCNFDWEANKNGR